MVTGTTVPVVCYRSFWFGTGTSEVRYRNIARRERYVTETSSKLHTPLLRFIGHRPIHKSRVKTRYDRTVCTPNIAALRHVVWEQSSFKVFCFDPRSRAGSGNHTLTGTVGDQWYFSCFIHGVLWWYRFICFCVWLSSSYGQRGGDLQ